jgi:hypothetical protein
MTNDDKSAPAGMGPMRLNEKARRYWRDVAVFLETRAARTDDDGFGYHADAYRVAADAVRAALAAPPAQPVTGCGKRMGGGLAPLKCGERTELRTVLCIDCLPAQPVREQGGWATCPYVVPPRESKGREGFKCCLAAGHVGACAPAQQPPAVLAEATIDAVRHG